jgi:UDP-3-O-[3-hydroxymyristoyl] glucosamine N-acyltransferase
MKASEIAGLVNGTLVGDDRGVTRPWPLRDPGPGDAITFCASNNAELVRNTTAGVVVCRQSFPVEGKTLIVVDNPRLAFARILCDMFAPRRPASFIHPSAIIYPNVQIGERVIVHANCVIGVEGFGYVRNERGELEWFPHVGGVVIGDDVEIHPFTNVDRGGLGDTTIGQGTKIDKFCHIGHNVRIGRHCLIAARTVLAGSATIGDYVTIWAGALIRNSITVGDRATIGMGSVVVKDVEAGTLVMGHPARQV